MVARDPFRVAAFRESPMAAEAAKPANFFLAEQNIVWLYSDDLDGMAHFYGEVLGLPQVLDQGACRVFRASPTGFIGICNTPTRPRGTRGMMFTFLVENVVAAHEHLGRRGVTFDGPPQVSADGTRCCCFFTDPEGYWLELQEFRDPRWPSRAELVPVSPVDPPSHR
jgi:catechol 2,3-dioxygenase-like lactoylglutathione lyase family enzyme